MNKGSITIEASLSVPFFFLSVLCFFYMLEVMAVRTSIKSGMQYAAKRAAEQAYLVPAVTPGQLEKNIIKAVGSERLNRSVIEGGSGGIHCEKSRMSPVTAILELHTSYKIKFPLAIFKVPSVLMEEKIRVKGWTGYVRSGFGNQEDTTVYITETGMVYHMDYHCTYLELSIHMVPSAGLEECRNEDGGKYYPCEHCMGGVLPGSVYITDTGDRYHSSLHCSGLKRTIYAVPLSEAAGKGVCKRCGK